MCVGKLLIFLKGFGLLFHSILDSTDVKPLMVNCFMFCGSFQNILEKLLTPAYSIGDFYISVSFFIMAVGT